MTDLEIRESILQVFQTRRQRPNTPFDEDNFLNYLTYPPGRKGSVKGTFVGARKYYRFMDSIEIKFGICFRLADLDKNYSLQNLTNKVKERLSKKAGNLQILSQREKYRDTYIFETVLIGLLIMIYFAFGFHWLSIVLTIGVGLILYWTFSSRYHSRQHNKKLRCIISGQK
jgi:hypothetical protein